MPPPDGPPLLMPTTVNGPPPTQAMSDVPPPTLAFGAPPAPPGAPSGPGFGPPPGPPGPSGPSGPGFGPPPAPPGSKTNTTFIVVAVIAVLALAGIAFAVSQDGDDEDGGGVAAGDGPGVTAPDVTTLDPDDLPSDGGDLPSDGGDLPSDEPGGLEPPEDFEPPEDTAPILEPAEAEVDDCIAVDSGGYFTGTGSCADGGTPYVVTEVVEGTQTCSNPEASYTPSGDYLLCLEYNLVETYCYVFPEGASGGVDGWITVASACEAPGTVHVIDIVPGADNGDQCTSDYEWNYWYGFTAPHMVACVMKY